MTDTDLTRLVMLLDRSGSMQSIKADVEGGFAAFIQEQAACRGTCTVSLARFDTEYELVYQDKDIEKIPHLDLRPRGATALLDAMARLILETDAELAAMAEKDRPGTVIVAIMTDGLENSSIEWTHAAVKSLVDQQRARGWQFVYMGADQDAVEVGVRMGIDADHSVTFARGKSREAMAAASSNIRGFREAAPEDRLGGMPAFSPEQRSDLGD